MAFTEKGLMAIEAIKEKYVTGKPFTAAELGINPPVLTALAKDGYIVRQDTKPVSYIYDANSQINVERDLPKKFAPYSVEEFNKQIQLTRDEFILNLNNKYGIVSGSYFCTPEMKSVNQKIKRGKEGLFIHHIMEEKAIMLSNPEFAIEQPYEYQLGENLVYCNIFEHLILHCLIVKNCDIKACEASHILPGIGGIFNYILPSLRMQYLQDRNNVKVENITLKDFGQYVAPYLLDLLNTDIYKLFALSCDTELKIENESFITYSIEYAKAMDNGGILKDARNRIIFSMLPVIKPSKEKVKRSDGYIYNNLHEASQSIGGGKGKAQKIKIAIEKNKKYGGFFWEYVTEKNI